MVPLFMCRVVETCVDWGPLADGATRQLPTGDLTWVRMVISTYNKGRKPLAGSGCWLQSHYRFRFPLEGQKTAEVANDRPFSVHSFREERLQEPGMKKPLGATPEAAFERGLTLSSQCFTR
jgi:hypothetical protein